MLSRERILIPFLLNTSSIFHSKWQNFTYYQRFNLILFYEYAATDVKLLYQGRDFVKKAHNRISNLAARFDVVANIALQVFDS